MRAGDSLAGMTHYTPADLEMADRIKTWIETLDGNPFGEFTSDIAGRGGPGQPNHPGPVPGNPASRTMPPDFTEHTTDVAGRGQ